MKEASILGPRRRPPSPSALRGEQDGIRISRSVCGSTFSDKERQCRYGFWACRGPLIGFRDNDKRIPARQCLEWKVRDRNAGT
jgi:hypothetical protein